MMERKNISAGSKWEPIIGYSRAVRVGNHVSVSGTAGVAANGKLEGDVHQQSVRSLQIIEGALKEAGASFKDVVRTRIYLTKAEDWELAAKAHGAVFSEIRPATTLVVVKALIDPAMLVEIEVDAIVS